MADSSRRDPDDLARRCGAFSLTGEPSSTGHCRKRIDHVNRGPRRLIGVRHEERASIAEPYQQAYMDGCPAPASVTKQHRQTTTRPSYRRSRSAEVSDDATRESESELYNPYAGSLSSRPRGEGLALLGLIQAHLCRRWSVHPTQPTTRRTSTTFPWELGDVLEVASSELNDAVRHFTASLLGGVARMECQEPRAFQVAPGSPLVLSRANGDRLHAVRRFAAICSPPWFPAHGIRNPFLPLPCE
jgi:hypothetical protein